jgi:hypothetical protein
MDLKLDATKLDTETRAALRVFGRAAKRYHDAKAKHKKEFVGIGDSRILAEKEISPRSIIEDYVDAKHALLKCKDPALRSILDQIDLDKLLDQTEGASVKARDDVYRKMVVLERDLAKFASKLK